MDLTFTNRRVGRLDVLITKAAAEMSGLGGVSRNAVQRSIKGGRVRVDNRVITDPAAKMGGGAGGRGEVIVAELPEAMASPSPKPQKVRFQVVFEDEHLIVVDKPPGLVVHPGAGNPDHTLVNGLLEHCRGKLAAGEAGRPGIVHRLDKDTGGLLVAAKEDRVLADLARQFRWRVAKRLYWAAVLGVPKLRGMVAAPLARHKANRLKMAVDPAGRAATTRWRRLRACYDEDRRAIAAIVVCSLKSGRTHQVRAHMASAGHPLLGDRLYGGGRAAKWLGRQALHAVRLGFVHPISKKWMRFKSPPPRDLINLANDLPSK